MTIKDPNSHVSEDARLRMVAFFAVITLLLPIAANAQPANDDASNAVSASLGINIVDNRGATSGGTISCADDNDVWYFFDAATAQCSAVVFDLSIDIVLPSAGYSPTLAVYDNAGTNELACDASSPPSITIPATNTTYWIRVGGVGGSTGTARLIINCSGPNTINGYVWEPVSNTDPSPRYDHSMVYDSTNQTVLLFGGRAPGSLFGDFYELDNNAPNHPWGSASLAGAAPPASYGHAIAFDRNRDRLVLFGGWTPTGRSNETYEYDVVNQIWHNPQPAIRPAARYYHGMAYDSVRGRTVLYGGSTNTGVSGETWEWNGSQWTLRTNFTCPTTLLCERFNFAMAYSPLFGATHIFGGTNGSTCFNDTASWNGTSWGISTAAGPTERSSHEMVWDSVRNEFVLYGGNTVGCIAGGGVESDTVVYQTTWAFKNSVGNQPRFGHAMAFDESIGAVVMHGGASSTVLSGETFIGEPGIPNDDPNGAIPITTNSSRTIDSQAATDGLPGCASGADLWYEYTATCTGQISISLTGGTFIPELAIYQGSAPGGALIACETGTTGFVRSEFIVTNGTTYTVRLGAVGGAGGVGSLHVGYCDSQSCPSTIGIGSQTQFLVEITGTASGLPWSWIVEWPSGFAVDYQVPGVAPGGTASDLAAAWVASINSHPCFPARLRAQQLSGGNSNKFLITIGGNQAFMNVAVGPAGQIPNCYLNPISVCPFNPDASQILLSGEDCNLNGEDDTIDLLQNRGLDANNNGVIDSCELVFGDVNCDERINGHDLSAFVTALTDPGQYEERYPACPILTADMDGDLLVTPADIEPFVLLLLAEE